jgi:hypothetical protein
MCCCGEKHGTGSGVFPKYSTFPLPVFFPPLFVTDQSSSSGAVWQFEVVVPGHSVFPHVCIKKNTMVNQLKHITRKYVHNLACNFNWNTPVILIIVVLFCTFPAWLHFQWLKTEGFYAVVHSTSSCDIWLMWWGCMGHIFCYMCRDITAITFTICL